MKHTFKITGMTCNGCRSRVETTIKSVEGVTKAEAVIEMSSHIP